MISSFLTTAVTWTVDPVLFSLGPVSVRWYCLMFVVGFFVGY